MPKVEAQPRFGVFLCDGEFGEESEVSFGGLDPRRASFNIGMTAVDDSYVGTIWDFDASLQNLKTRTSVWNDMKKYRILAESLVVVLHGPWKVP